MQTPTNILALDVGDKRIGVAVAVGGVRLAHPLTTLEHNTAIWERLAELVQEHQAGAIVVGLPRGLDGQDTAQTQRTLVFVQELRARLGLPVHAQDEAVTSVQAEAELRHRGVPYQKADVDALAATYILQDYIDEKGA